MTFITVDHKKAIYDFPAQENWGSYSRKPNSSHDIVKYHKQVDLKYIYIYIELGQFALKKKKKKSPRSA